MNYCTLMMRYGNIGETPDNGETENLFGGNGSVFHLHFLGSVEIDEKGGRKRRKRLKNSMVEIAVTKIKVCQCFVYIYFTRWNL